MKSILIFCMIFLLLPQHCYASDIETRISKELQLDRLEDSVPPKISDMLEDYDMTSANGITAALKNIKNYIVLTFEEQIQAAYKPAVQILILILICSLVSVIFPGKKGDFSILLTGSFAITYLFLGDAKSYFSYSIEVIQSMYDFSSILLPCLAGASVFAGASISAGVKYTAAALFMNILLNFSNTILIPLVSVYLACTIGDSVFKHPILSVVSKFIRWITITFLTGSVVIFTAYLSIAGILTGTGELLSARIAKTTISNGLPIVGQIISNTASTLIAGASMLRNSVGIWGILVVLGIIIVPLISVGVRYFLFKIVSEFSEVYPEKRFANLIKGIADAYGMLFAIIGTGFVMLFLSILSFMQLVGV